MCRRSLCCRWNGSGVAAKWLMTPVSLIKVRLSKRCALPGHSNRLDLWFECRFGMKIKPSRCPLGSMCPSILLGDQFNPSYRAPVESVLLPRVFPLEWCLLCKDEDKPSGNIRTTWGFAARFIAFLWSLQRAFWNRVWGGRQHWFHQNENAASCLVDWCVDGGARRDRRSLPNTVKSEFDVNVSWIEKKKSPPFSKLLPPSQLPPVSVFPSLMPPPSPSLLLCPLEVYLMRTFGQSRAESSFEVGH